ncbi:MAG TPA: 4Fe-4S binding protein [Kofleriaceae bacterium]|nr:4Fe-4S binding protein [Kofleriaceae bacterium]
MAVLAGAWFVVLASAGLTSAGAIDCAEVACAEVLPGAERFEAVDGAPYVLGFDSAGQELGWVVRSSDIVEVKAYSGKPLVTLIGLDTRGVIVGARLLHHSEPILLVGIPERKLHEFIARYRGLPAVTKVVVGTSADPDAVSMDIISGATVTALAQNHTILETARTLGVEVGVVDVQAVNPGHFAVRDVPMSWQEMVDGRVFGRLTVSEADMGVPGAQGDFIDLWFTLADPPHIGRALLADAEYEHLLRKLQPGEHLLVVLGNGSSSFKGSAFVRGGIFDRVRVEQGMRELTFRDTDYSNLPVLRAADAPEFKEGAVFITRGAPLDPGAPFRLVFLGSRYDQRGAFSRDFREFDREHRLPSSVYVSEGNGDEPMYVQAWRNNRTDALLLGGFLLLVSGIFAARRFTTARPARIKRLHVIVMAASLVLVGFYLRAQPSVTQMLTLIDSVVHEWRWELFASAPLIFMMWIFIAITSVIWGRGIFCGWVCPYGAMTELLNKLAVKLRIPQIDIPQGRQKYVRYFILAALVPVFLTDAVLGEQLAEIEPFKSTFFVRVWTREAFFIIWWSALLILSVVTFRPFCRFLCPLGAGLALFGSARISGPRRRQFCSSCQICARNCEPKAIRPDGTIDPRECLSCMDCEATYRNENVCPPLIGIDKLLRKPVRSARDEERLIELHKAKRDV